MKKGIILIVLLLLLVGCNSKCNITSLTYKYGFGNSSYINYEIKYEDNKYRLKYEKKENGNVIAKIKELKQNDVKKIEKIIKKYEIDKWDGFDESENSTLDGSYFKLEVQYNSGESIKASGHMKTPDNYEEGHHALIELLKTFIE